MQTLGWSSDLPWQCVGFPGQRVLVTECACSRTVLVAECAFSWAVLVSECVFSRTVLVAETDDTSTPDAETVAEMDDT